MGQTHGHKSPKKGDSGIKGLAEMAKTLSSDDIHSKNGMQTCKGCGGSGVGLVTDSGYCDHCNRQGKPPSSGEKEKGKKKKGGSKQRSLSDDFVIVRNDTPPPMPPPPPQVYGVHQRQLHMSDKGQCCPICMTLLNGLNETQINNHVDECLVKQIADDLSPRKPCKSCSMVTDVNPQGYCLSCTNEYLARKSGVGRDQLLVSTTNPFKVKCPYASCYLPTMEAAAFPSHVASAHSAAPSHKYSCPVCFLVTGENYPVNDNTNLLEHVKNRHQDMMNYQPPPPMPKAPSYPKTNPSDFVDDDGIDYSKFVDEDGAEELIRRLAALDAAGGSMTTTTTTTTVTPSHVGSRFVEEVLSAPIEKECSICFEDFAVGDTIARLECFCVFHKDCILIWFKKSDNKCPLHKD